MTGVCTKCGRAPKVKGQGQHFCADCKEAAAWLASRKRQTRALVKRRPCLICGGVKEPGHGRDICLRCAAERKPKRKCMSCPALIDAPARKCERCRAIVADTKRRYERERHRRNRREHPEWYVRDSKRKRKTKKDNEGQRMRHRLRAEQAGRPIAPVAVLPRVHTERSRRVPTAPLLAFIRQALAEIDVTELGRAAHMRPYEIGRVITGEVVELRDWQADRLCVAMGLQFNLLYAQTG
jgi:hypothetical protein